MKLAYRLRRFIQRRRDKKLKAKGYTYSVSSLTWEKPKGES